MSDAIIIFLAISCMSCPRPAPTTRSLTSLPASILVSLQSTLHPAPELPLQLKSDSPHGAQVNVHAPPACPHHLNLHSSLLLPPTLTGFLPWVFLDHAKLGWSSCQGFSCSSSCLNAPTLTFSIPCLGSHGPFSVAFSDQPIRNATHIPHTHLSPFLFAHIVPPPPKCMFGEIRGFVMLSHPP